MTESAIAIQGITQVSIRVSDVERASSFYAGTLGLSLLYKQANMALADCNGIRLLLSPAETSSFDHPSSTLYFQVADLEECYRKLLAQNVEFSSKPHKIAEFGGKAIWMAFFYDPDRNVHALTSEIPIEA